MPCGHRHRQTKTLPSSGRERRQRKMERAMYREALAAAVTTAGGRRRFGGGGIAPFLYGIRLQGARGDIFPRRITARQRFPGNCNDDQYDQYDGSNDRTGRNLFFHGGLSKTVFPVGARRRQGGRSLGASGRFYRRPEARSLFSSCRRRSAWLNDRNRGGTCSHGSNPNRTNSVCCSRWHRKCSSDRSPYPFWQG